MYIVECADNTLYTGITNNLKERMLAHNSKKWAKYTSSRTPVTLVYSEENFTKSEALKREIRIKKLSRKQKLILINKNKIISQ